MISQNVLLIRLQKERMKLRKDLKTDFVLGVLRGLGIAIFTVGKLIEDSKEIPERYEINRNLWSASQFRKAIIASLAYFKRADRARGIAILEDALLHGGKQNSAYPE